jgi:hypothetical protein
VFEHERSVLSESHLDNLKETKCGIFSLNHRRNAENASGWIMKWSVKSLSSAQTHFKGSTRAFGVVSYRYSGDWQGGRC